MNFFLIEHVVAQGLAAAKTNQDCGDEAEVNDFDDDDDDEDDEDKQLDTDTPDVQKQRRLVRYLRVSDKKFAIHFLNKIFF